MGKRGGGLKEIAKIGLKRNHRESGWGALKEEIERGGGGGGFGKDHWERDQNQNEINQKITEGLRPRKWKEWEREGESQGEKQQD